MHFPFRKLWVCRVFFISRNKTVSIAANNLLLVLVTFIFGVSEYIRLLFHLFCVYFYVNIWSTFLFFNYDITSIYYMIHPFDIFILTVVCSYIFTSVISQLLYVYYILIFIHLIFYIYHSDFRKSDFFSRNDTYKTFLVKNRWKNWFLYFLAYLANLLVRKEYEWLLYNTKVRHEHFNLYPKIRIGTDPKISDRNRNEYLRVSFGFNFFYPKKLKPKRTDMNRSGPENSRPEKIWPNKKDLYPT